MKNLNTYTNNDMKFLLKVLKSILNFMREKNINVDPTPKLRFHLKDEENAKNFFGKTAEYLPDEKVIYIYLYGRHPKDIVRSFCHEMIHHEQNLNGKTNREITGTNVNEDDWLSSMEKEAYLKGNIVFRSWCDKFKNKFKVEIKFE